MILLVVFLLLWLVPKWQVAPLIAAHAPAKDIFDAENAARTTLAQIFGGLVLVAGAVFAGWQVNVARQGQATAREGQITERFTRAIDQLGNDKLAARLGGIYALERIAADSMRDAWPIMETLTAFVRENVPWSPKPDNPASGVTPGSEPPKPRADIQAIATVIGRRSQTFLAGEWLNRLDLHATDLRGIRFVDAHLERANLKDAHLEVAFLVEPDLGSASFARIKLKTLKGVAAQLEGGNLKGADLGGATLWGADLRGAKLLDAHLEGVHLEGADLSKAEGLTQEQIDRAWTDKDTRLPSGLRLPPCVAPIVDE
ncbi:MAG: pentapeptide repeat-containing protein [Candidatus Binataceae bacterium]